MATTVSPLAKSFTIKIENKYDEAKNLCLFSGTLDTSAIVKDVANSDALVFTKGNPAPVQNYSQKSVDCVMVDGVLPVIDQSKGLILPAATGQCMTAKSLNPQFTINSLKDWLRSNCYAIKRSIVTVSEQAQFENPITMKTSSPTENLGDKTILPTNYNSPDQFNDKKIIIDNFEMFLQDDTMMFWLVNPRTTITMTFEFTENQ